MKKSTRKAKTEPVTITRELSDLERKIEQDRAAIDAAIWPTHPPLYEPALPSHPGGFHQSVRDERDRPPVVTVNGVRYRSSHLHTIYGVDIR